MIDDQNLTVEERDALQAAKSPNPAAKASSLARARRRETEETKERQAIYDRTMKERAERRANTP